MSYTWLVPLPVMIPLFAAGLALALYRRPRLQQVISVVALMLMVVFSAWLMAVVDAGPIVVNSGGWAAPVGVALVGDRLSALMLTVSSTVLLSVMVYSIGQELATGTTKHLSRSTTPPIWRWRLESPTPSSPVTCLAFMWDSKCSSWRHTSY